MAPLCKLVKRGAVRANELPLRNDLEAWPDSSVCRALDAQSQGSRVRIPLGSAIFSHFHFSYIYIYIYISENVTIIHITSQKKQLVDASITASAELLFIIGKVLIDVESKLNKTKERTTGKHLKTQ